MVESLNSYTKKILFRSIIPSSSKIKVIPKNEEPPPYSLEFATKSRRTTSTCNKPKQPRTPSCHRSKWKASFPNPFLSPPFSPYAQLGSVRIPGRRRISQRGKILHARSCFSLREKKEKKERKRTKRKTKRRKDKFEGRTRDRGWFYAALDPGYSPRTIPWYPSPLTTAISSRLIRLLSLFVPLRFREIHPSPPWDASTASISKSNLFWNRLNETGQPWPATIFISAIQFLLKRICDKGGEGCATRFDEKRNPWGRWANFRRFIHLSRYRLSAGGCWSKCWLLCGEGKNVVFFSFFFSGCFERIFFNGRSFWKEEDGMRERGW